MSDTGERPTDGEEATTEEVHRIVFGETVYNEDGNALGRVRGLDEGGFFVTTRKGVEALSSEHAVSGPQFGEAELMWRCTVCGEMGDIQGGLPEACPNCGTESENLMYWTED